MIKKKKREADREEQNDIRSEMMNGKSYDDCCQTEDIPQERLTYLFYTQKLHPSMTAAAINMR